MPNEDFKEIVRHLPNKRQCSNIWGNLCWWESSTCDELIATSNYDIKLTMSSSDTPITIKTKDLFFRGEEIGFHS